MHTAENTAVIKYPIVPKIFFAVICVGALYLPFIHSNKHILLNVQELLPSLLVAAPFLLMLVFMLSTRVEISGDLLSVHMGFSKWQLRRREVARYFTYTVRMNFQTVHILVLVPKDPGQKQRRIWPWLHKTPAFKAWLKGVPQTPRVKPEHAEQAPQPTPPPAPARGSRSPRARFRHIPVKIVRQRLRLVIFGFYAIYGIMFLGDFLFPHPPGWWTFLFFVPPLCALQLERMYPEYVRLAAGSLPQDKRASRYKRVSVTGVFVLPCILLPLWQLEETHFRDIWQFVILTAVLTTLFTAYALHRAPELRASVKLSACVLIFALGGASALTTEIDTADPFCFTQAETTVTEHYEAHGRYVSHNYVVVQPVANLSAPVKFDVSEAFYKRLHAGSKVCVRLHPGTLGIRWYSLGYCCKDL